MRRVFNYIFWICASACMLIAGWLFLRIFICDQFVIPSESMMPTLLPGDRILVNKLLAGSPHLQQTRVPAGCSAPFVPHTRPQRGACQ